MLPQVHEAPQWVRCMEHVFEARLLSELQRPLSQAGYAHLCALISESWPASKVMPLAHILVIDLKQSQRQAGNLRTSPKQSHAPALPPRTRTSIPRRTAERLLSH